MLTPIKAKARMSIQKCNAFQLLRVLNHDHMKMMSNVTGKYH